MKKNFLAAAFAFAALSVASCSSDDNNDSNNQNPTPTQVSNIVTSGAWRITNYVDNGNNETSDFANYNFVFNANNTISASNGTNNYNGIWFVENDDDDNDDTDFNINFSSPQLFADLTEDWDIIELTSTKIRLQDNDDDGTDYLTFEKN